VHSCCVIVCVCLGISGLVSSSQNLAYTVSKFCGGVLSDAVNAKLLFVISLFFCGLCTVSMTG